MPASSTSTSTMPQAPLQQSDQQFSFTSSESLGDLDILDSLDSPKARRFFTRFPTKPPTLEEALRAAGIQNVDIVVEDSKEYAQEALETPSISSLGLTDDEAGAIACYTLQLPQGVKSPYEVINEGLAGSRNRSTLSTARRLIYLFLNGLRKLPRYRVPAGEMLYRGMKVKVPTTLEEAKGHQYYAKGRTVTWWAFTSTTLDGEVTSNFIRKSPESTLFNISGADLWGYDIRAFSQFPEEAEVLLEPEAKVDVISVIRHQDSILSINIKLQPFKHLVLEDIIPVGGAKPQQRGGISTGSQ